MRKVLSLILIATSAVTIAFATGCGGDDTNPANGTDSGSDAPITVGEGGTGDGGDAGCNFATFVQGLITNDTNGTALPSTDLGQGCVDNQNQAEFKPLFP